MKAPVLQSGFISLTEKGLELPKIVKPGVRDLILDKEIDNPLNVYFFSTEITDLFTIWSNKPDCIRDFEYRERLIKAAYKAFATTSFYDWLWQQNNRASIGEIHVAFITETLEYLSSDVPRRTENILWYRIITAHESSTSVKWDLTKYFVAQGNSKPSVPMKLDDLMTLWFRKTDGFQDLLITLYTIFGERTARMNTTKQTY